ncbi:BTB/POZ and MATH domain-containing protein 1-like [Panicum miliaceum]|uniref:BTB/POZ and MATH domain-containing protein 1-like n=1 Tax=Panicum miliaceum TaxID=4540 RepID=A0A3L6SSW3_PANMI|nr:BTB/POZ and MATH domain-containing protein 1-like [Panicum miliaceum]
MDVALVPEEVASTCHIEASSGSHVFKIAGYSLTQGMGVGRCLQSSAFTVAGHDWAVVFYPDGHGINESADHVSVFVTLLSDTASPEDKDVSTGGAVRTYIDFGLVDQRRSPPVIKKESRLSYSFASQGASAGYAREGEVAGTVAAAPQASVLTSAYRHVTTRTWPALRQRFGTPEGLAFLLELLLKCLMVYVNGRLRQEEDDDDCRRKARCRCRSKCGRCCCKV